MKKVSLLKPIFSTSLVLLVVLLNAQPIPMEGISITTLDEKENEDGAVVYYLDGNKFTGKTHDIYFKEQKSYSSIIRDGLRQVEYGWDENKTLIRHYQYQDGLLHGDVILYFGDSNPYVHHRYNQGEMEGQQFGWYNNGQLRFDSFYKKGIKQYQKDFDRDGKQILTIHSLTKFF